MTPWKLPYLHIIFRFSQVTMQIIIIEHYYYLYFCNFFTHSFIQNWWAKNEQLCSENYHILLISLSKWWWNHIFHCYKISSFVDTLIIILFFLNKIKQEFIEETFRNNHKQCILCAYTAIRQRLVATVFRMVRKLPPVKKYVSSTFLLSLNPGI